PLQTAVYGAIYIILTTVLAFPLSVYTDFFREHQYGMANQDFGGWFGDWLKALGLSVVLACPLMMALVGTVRRLPRTWHIWGAILTIGFIVVFVLIGPVFINPVFNKYTLLQDEKVLTPILRMARANGIATDKVYEMDASKQTKRISANVSGL